MPTFKYKAIRIRQTDSGDWLVLFAASAVEIEMWSGIPQKKKIGTQETTGFQREENRKRIREISSFYQDEKNIIQNPLLCALRKLDLEQIKFKPNDSKNDPDELIQHGYLEITTEFLENLSLLELLKRVKTDLEQRVPDLSKRIISESFIKELKQRAEINSDLENSLSEAEEEQESENSDSDENLEISLADDESHIADFWEEVSAYVSILEEIENTFNGDRFLDYSKEAIISFLRPIVIVDGQHRLRAAVSSAKKLAKEDKYKEQIEEALADKEANPDEIQRQIEAQIARKLPVSLLMNTDPAEQVFQFVVVNQKATPIKPALLGTIVSTSLSNEELERVSYRL